MFWHVFQYNGMSRWLMTLINHSHKYLYRTFASLTEIYAKKLHAIGSDVQIIAMCTTDWHSRL